MQTTKFCYYLLTITLRHSWLLQRSPVHMDDMIFSTLLLYCTIRTRPHTTLQAYRSILSAVPMWTSLDAFRFGETTSIYVDIEYQHMTYDHGWGLSHERRLAAVRCFDTEPPSSLGNPFVSHVPKEKCVHRKTRIISLQTAPRPGSANGGVSRVLQRRMAPFLQAPPTTPHTPMTPTWLIPSESLSQYRIITSLTHDQDESRKRQQGVLSRRERRESGRQQSWRTRTYSYKKKEKPPNSDLQSNQHSTVVYIVCMHS